MRFRLTKAMLPLLASLGVVAAAIAVITAPSSISATKPLSEPASAPFSSYIGGTGKLEPPGQTVGIGAPDGGIVVDVPITPGDEVKAGQTLFRIDDRVKRADRDQRIADVETAVASVREAQAGAAP